MTADPFADLRKAPAADALFDKIRQLTTEGWTAREIGDELGFSAAWVDRLRRKAGIKAHVGGRSALWIASHEPPDPIAVARAINGERPDHLNHAEIIEAVTRLTRRGRSIREIAEMLRISRRTVERCRQRARQITDQAEGASTGVS